MSRTIFDFGCHDTTDLQMLRAHGLKEAQRLVDPVA